MGQGTIFGFAERFMHDESGATAVEYGLMLAIFSLIVTTALATVGTNLTAMFTKVVNFLK